MCVESGNRGNVFNEIKKKRCFCGVAACGTVSADALRSLLMMMIMTISPTAYAGHRFEKGGSILKII